MLLLFSFAYFILGVRIDGARKINDRPRNLYAAVEENSGGSSEEHRRVRRRNCKPIES